MVGLATVVVSKLYLSNKQTMQDSTAKGYHNVNILQIHSVRRATAWHTDFVSSLSFWLHDKPVDRWQTKILSMGLTLTEKHSSLQYLLQ